MRYFEEKIKQDEWRNDNYEMFKRERERLFRDREKVQKELDRKRVENDKIFQRKKDFDLMINELFKEGKGEERKIIRARDSIGQIKRQLLAWEDELKQYLRQDQELRTRITERQQELIQRGVSGESERQLLETQVRLLESDMAKIEEGRLTSLSKQFFADFEVEPPQKLLAVPDLPAQVRRREDGFVETEGEPKLPEGRAGDA